MTIPRPVAARVFGLALAAFACLGVAACGGGSKDTTPVPANIVVGPDSAFSGHLLELTVGLTYVPTTDTTIEAGDDVANNHKKGYIRFDLSGVPAGAQVQDATITITQEAPVGTPYLDLLTNLQVDHIDMGAALDAADWNGGSLSLNIGTISNNTTLGTKTLSVGPQVALDLAQGRTTSDFRLSFPVPTDNNGDIDIAVFTRPNFIGGPTLTLNLLVPPP